MPVRDLGAPLAKRAAELVQLRAERFVSQIAGQLVERLERCVVVGYAVDAAQGLLGVPCVSHFASWVAGGEQTPQLRLAAHGDALGGSQQQPAYPVQRVVLGAPPAGGLVLHASAHVVDGAVGEPHDVERVGDLAGLGQRIGERLAVGTRQVHHRPPHPGSPSRRASLDPSGGAVGAATSDYVEQLASSGVHDSGAPLLFAVRAAAEHQNLVEPQRGDAASACSVGVEQSAAPAMHRRHGGMPIASQLGGDLADRSAHPGPPCRPPRRPGGHPRPGQRNSRVLVGEGPHRTALVGAQPATLVPHQPHRPPERRQVRQPDSAAAVRPHLAAAAPTTRPSSQLDPDPQRAAAAAPHLSHRHTGSQTDEQPQPTRKVNSHRDPPDSGQQDTSDSGGSLPTSLPPSPDYSTRKREAPDYLGFQPRPDLLSPSNSDRVSRSDHSDYPYDIGSCGPPDAWAMYQGQCTSYVAWRLNDAGIPFDNFWNNNGAGTLPDHGGSERWRYRWSHAVHWAKAARAVGIDVDDRPSPGSIAHFTGDRYGHRIYGHVAYVERVLNNGSTIVYSEMNHAGSCGFNRRTVDRGDWHWPDSFIHFERI